MLSLQEIRQLQWVSHIKTGTDAAVVLIAKKAGHKIVVHVVIIGSNDPGPVGTIYSLCDEIGGTEFAHFVGGRGAPTPIYCTVKHDTSNNIMAYNVTGTGTYESCIIVGYTYEPDPTGPHK